MKVVQVFRCGPGQSLSLPLFGEALPAGFPSPAEGYVEKSLSLDEHLIRRPAATFFVRAAGESMLGAGIQDGDLLIVDRSVEARDGSIVVAALDGAFTVKHLRLRGGRAWLVGAPSDAHPPVEIDPEQELCVWGVVTAAVTEFAVRRSHERNER